MKKLVVLAVVAALAAAFTFLPWWAGVALVVGLGLAAKLLIGTVFRRFFVGMFEAKSAVLRGASARLHAVSVAPEPKRDFDDDFVDEDVQEIDDAPRDYRYIDVTIEVPERDAESGDCGMMLWEPEELMVVPSDAKPGRDFEDEHDFADVHSVEMMEGGDWVMLEGEKVFGTQRVRLHVGVTPGVDEFRLRYYFEVLRAQH